MRSILVLGAAAITAAAASHAAVLPGQGIWASVLQGRDLDRDLSTHEAYYDPYRNITWMANAHILGYTTEELGYDFEQNGFTNWRSPTMPKFASCESIENPELKADCYHLKIASTPGSEVESEIGYLYYTILGNGRDKPFNSGPFANMSGTFWAGSGEVIRGGYSIGFDVATGEYGIFHGGRDRSIWTWVLRDGDITAPPQPDQPPPPPTPHNSLDPTIRLDPTTSVPELSSIPLAAIGIVSCVAFINARKRRLSRLTD